MIERLFVLACYLGAAFSLIISIIIFKILLSETPFNLTSKREFVRAMCRTVKEVINVK